MAISTSIINRIKSYIDIKVPYDVAKRGEKLFRQGAIQSYNIENKQDSATFTVQGTQIYEVTINGLNSSIRSECSCPYNWGPVCKHQVACFLSLIEELGGIVDQDEKEILTAKSKKIAKQPLHISSQPIEIKEFKTITEEHFYDDLSGKSRRYLSIQDQSKFENGILSFIVAEHNHIAREYIIKFWFKRKKLYSTCGCSKSVEKLCPHQAFLLEEFFFSNENIFDFFSPPCLKALKKEILSDYGLMNKKFDDVAKITVNGFTPGWELLPEYKDLLPVSGEKQLDTVYIIKDNLSFYNSEQSRIAKSQYYKSDTEKRVPGYIINTLKVFDKYVNDRVDIQTITGNLIKSGNKMKSSGIKITDITQIEKEVILDDKQKQFLEKLNFFQVSNASYSKEERDKFEENQIKTYELLTEIFPHLSDEKFVFIVKEKDFLININKNIIPVVVSKEAMTFEFELLENDEFLYLKPIYRLGDRYFSPEKKDEKNSHLFFSCFHNTLYLHASFNDSIFFRNVLLWPKKVMFSGAEAFLKSIIIPLSKYFKIHFKAKRFSFRKVALKPLKKQIYLSEYERYVVFKPFVKYDNKQQFNPLIAGGEIELDEGTQLVEYVRDTDYEQEYTELLTGLHPRFENQKHDGLLYLEADFILNDFWFFDAYETLEKRGVEIFGVKNLKSFSYSPYRAKVTTGINSGQDWFEVDLQVAFGNNIVDLKNLRKAVINNNKFIKLNDGTVGILPEKWLGKLEKYFRAGEIENEKIKVSKLRFAIIGELFDKIDDFQIKKELAEKKRKFRAIENIKNVRKPREITATLRNYQKEGLNWLHFLHGMGWGGILADDMGLGKTLQILAFLQKTVKTSKKPNLVIVPTTLLFNWEIELKKFAPKLNYHIYYGINRNKEINYFKEYHLIFTTYGLVMRDIEFLNKFNFNYVILDESQAIKNPGSLRYKAVSLLKAKNRLALTGTPIENSTFDLYAQMNFVNPGFLGSLSSFKEYYSNAIDKEGNSEIALELNKIIKPFVLRRTKEQVAADLPEKTENIIFCEMSVEQRKIYDAFRNKYRHAILKRIESEGITKSKIYILEGLMKLRQICDSPALLNENETYENISVKIEELLRHVNEKTANHKILVFSQFVKMLHLIRTELQTDGIEYEYLDGKSSKKKRENSVNNFQENSKCRVFLISIKAGGTGLNLTAADYVYIVDPWWNPAVENQAIDRTHRIGQGKKVFAYRMICKNTVEEKILDLQAKKKQIAQDIITTDEGLLKKLTTKDIHTLFT